MPTARHWRVPGTASPEAGPLRSRLLPLHRHPNLTAALPARKLPWLHWARTELPAPGFQSSTSGRVALGTGQSRYLRRHLFATTPDGAAIPRGGHVRYACGALSSRRVSSSPPPEPEAGWAVTACEPGRL